jgi:hypothetical protein
MKTAYEVALEKLEAAESIPRMTDPLGKYWEQPDRSEIVIDDTHALMSLATFEKLMEYSGSQPTGAYEGKMWRRNDGSCDWEFMAQGGKPTWYLCWYGRSDKPEYVSNNRRKIILSDGELPDE